MEASAPRSFSFPSPYGYCCRRPWSRRVWDLDIQSCVRDRVLSFCCKISRRVSSASHRVSKMSIWLPCLRLRPCCTHISYCPRPREDGLPEDAQVLSDCPGNLDVKNDLTFTVCNRKKIGGTAISVQKVADAEVQIQIYAKILHLQIGIVHQGLLTDLVVAGYDMHSTPSWHMILGHGGRGY